MTHKPAVIGIDGIRELLPHRDPMLMIDEVVTFVAGVSAHARKTVHALEPWAAGHFPGNPVFPGVLLTEAFAQTAGIVALTAEREHAGRAVYLVGLDRVRFRRPVHPGDILDIWVETIDIRRSIWRFQARAEVNGERTAEAELMATVADRS